MTYLPASKSVCDLCGPTEHERQYLMACEGGCGRTVCPSCRQDFAAKQLCDVCEARLWATSVERAGVVW